MLFKLNHIKGQFSRNGLSLVQDHKLFFPLSEAQLSPETCWERYTFGKLVLTARWRK